MDKKTKNQRILVISDQHFPYNHPDIIAFLKAIKEKYKPDRITNVGDEIDWHSISFHDHSPDLMSPSDELKTAINRMKAMYALFPNMDIVDSNHGSLVYRRGSAFGLPRSVLKSYRDMLGAPKGWNWHNHLTIQMSNGAHVYICHNKSSDVLRNSQSYGMSFIQGHYHEKAEIRYWGNSLGLYWGMTVGCLIEDESLAFSYNKTNLKRPIISAGMVINGHPLLIPMILKTGGRWTGKLPY